MRRFLSVPIGFAIFALALAGLATTWGKTPVDCGLCGKSVQMESTMSYGSYIYGWPSKYQLIFWPATESRALYYCKHCGLSALMGDFQKIPGDRKKAIARAVKPLYKKTRHKHYHQVPLPYRLKIAEAVYRQLDRDDNFWCRFYRVKGYHLEKAKKPKAARAARKKALALAEKMLAAGVDRPARKELVLIIGSMQYFTGEKQKALQTLARVAATPIRVPEEMDQKGAKNATRYLDQLAGDFISLIEGGKEVPR